MNAYDFDETIYNPDSSYSFYIYCLKNWPAAVLPTLPKTAVKGLLYALKKLETKALKEQLFSFLKRLPDVDKVVLDFWQVHRGGIGSWYLKQKRDDDLIISASPEFLLKPIADELGVRLIATPMDKLSGKILGKNCHDVEKVRRFNETFPGVQVDEFYSDSLSDTPMAQIAEKAFLVNKGSISPWP